MTFKNHYEAFSRIVGSDNCYIDQPHRQAYSYDATRQTFLPDAVIFPRNEADVQAILKYANQHKIPITPRGAGSGFTGGSLSAQGGAVLALEKHMNKILEIDFENMLARVQPAVINKDLQNAVEAHGLFYPPDPASQDYSTIGGNVSENAGGMRAAKYGITKNFVLALRAVLPNGELIRAGKKTIKDVAGYNVAGLLCASEGTLAVITEITLKLLPKPKLTLTAMGVFSSVAAAMSATYKSFINGVTPVAMEFLDNLTIKAVETAYKKGLPIDAGALLITEVDGNVEADILWQIETLQQVFKENGCGAFFVAKNDMERDAIWFARRNASQSLKVYGPTKLNEDITVPRSALPELLKRITAIGEKYDHQIPCFGHTGDGNVHVNVMTNRQDMVRYHNAEKAVRDIFEAAVDLEGTLSGEHGIGVSKAPFMNMAFSQSEMNFFRTIKNAIDPNNILNPGKMGL
ncbi:MAG: FAD-binding protein [Helicobacteraceae bacterium]|jgi:glycolate oxidase|nr:FAD-binding protein [Helicobacteraceae bacterium]